MSSNAADSVDMERESSIHPGTAADESSMETVVDYLGELLYTDMTSYTFVYFRSLDDAGHRYGFCSDQYLQAMNVIDGYVSTIINILTMITISHIL